MRVVKLLLALLPLAYIGWLLWFFLSPMVGTGGVEDARVLPGRLMESGLGPTVLGLGVVGLIFCLPVLFRAAMLFVPAAPPAKAGGALDEDAATVPTFDADAALDRYLARKALTPKPVATTPAAPPRPAGFGRKRG